MFFLRGLEMGSRCWYVWSGGAWCQGLAGGRAPTRSILLNKWGSLEVGMGAPAGGVFQGSPLGGSPHWQRGGAGQPWGPEDPLGYEPHHCGGRGSAETLQRLKIGGGGLCLCPWGNMAAHWLMTCPLLQPVSSDPNPPNLFCTEPHPRIVARLNLA